MFPYSFGNVLQESVVKIEFGPVGNPILRQICRKVPKNRGFFCFIIFFRPKEYWDLILSMINGHRNSWTARKNLFHWSQIAIPFAKWRISNVSDIQFWKPHDFVKTLYSKAFGVADYEFDIGFSEFKMADIIFWKPNDFRGTLYSRAFGVADYRWKSNLKFVWKSNLKCDPENPRVQSCAKIVDFPKFHVRHIGSASSKNGNPKSNL